MPKDIFSAPDEPSDEGAEAEPHVVIVGGGASGVLLACHLLRNLSDAIRVTLIERAATIGRGLAYGTENPAHLLNVRAANMSAFADDPDHFWRWLQAANLSPPAPDRFCFVSRQIYGRYIEAVLHGLSFGNSRALRIVRGECVAAVPARSGVTVAMRDGSKLAADIVVLATGNESCRTQPPGEVYASPWITPSRATLPDDGRVLIVGTGLTMIDYVQSLLLAGHRGPILAISRHGLLPQPHRPVVPVPIDRTEIPFGHDIADLARWFRAMTAIAQQRGGDWRSVVDGVRPFTQELWQSLPETARRRFMRHARTWWDIHRHRMAPEVSDTLARAAASGQLTIKAAKIQSVVRGDHGATVTFRPRGSARVETVDAACIVECTGITSVAPDTANPVLRSLFDAGLARIDPLGIGVEATADCALVATTGEPSDRIFAVGPLTRAAFWEIVAVPDIRAQCDRLAEQICARLTADQ